MYRRRYRRRTYVNRETKTERHDRVTQTIHSLEQVHHRISQLKDPRVRHCAFLHYVLGLVDEELYEMEQAVKDSGPLKIRLGKVREDMASNVAELLIWVQKEIGMEPKPLVVGDAKEEEDED